MVIVWYGEKREGIMKSLLERNQRLLDKIHDVTDEIWENQGGNNRKIIECIKEINVVLQEFIQRIEEFRQYGVDIPEQVILEQMRNLMSGFESKDSVLLADTMDYEITNTILFYNDILTELEKEQESSS